MASFGIFWTGQPKGGGGPGWGGGEVDGRECHVGSIVARGKGVAGGKAFVFNEK